MYVKMDEISNVSIVPCNESKYIKTVRVIYTQKDIQKSWDAIRVHDSVAILVFNISRQVFVFVKQFRPAIYINSVETYQDDIGVTRINTDKYRGKLGVTIELCAGILDKEHSPQETAQHELMEECGYKVPLDCLKKITTCRAGVGTTGSQQTIYYAEVTDAMRIGDGGGLEEEGELIDVVEMSVEEGRKLIWDEAVNKPIGLMFALLWFFDTVWKKNDVKIVM